MVTPESSPQESIITQNYMTEIFEISSPKKSNIDEASQYLAQLCDKAFNAKDGANRANQEEILYNRSHQILSEVAKIFETSNSEKILFEVTKLTTISIPSSSISNHSMTTFDNSL
ncbi:2802_t:CDS:2, partial [Gigaspora rosea]